jgi:hypothetical protein
MPRCQRGCRARRREFVEYCLQLALYRSLINAERPRLDISRFRLVYLWPTPVAFEIRLDRRGIEAALAEIGLQL